MTTKTYIINPELRDLLSPLSPKQLEKLEAEILADGCTNPLTVWGETIVDGHNRYEICTKHDIRFHVTQKTFETLDDAKFWIWNNQGSRRNLTRFQRVETTLKMKSVVAAKSKARQIRKPVKSVPHNCAEQKDTRQILAEFANVSHATVERVEYILKFADDETLNRLRWDETTINKEYNWIKKEQEAKDPAKTKKSSPSKAATTKKNGSEKNTAQSSDTSASGPIKKSSKPKDETALPFKTGLYCRPGEMPGATGDPYVRTSSLTDLPHDQPEVLVAQLIAHFPRSYARRCPILLLEALRANDGSETTTPLIEEIVRLLGE